MSNNWFCSDPHIGHRAITKYRTRFETAEQHHEFILKALREGPFRKRDRMYILGDVIFDINYLQRIADLPFDVIMLRGNHDEKISTSDLLLAFTDILGCVSYKGFWLSHFPMHPIELRGKVNVHGHVHNQTIQDHRYINVCMENIGYRPVSLDTLKHIRNNPDDFIKNEYSVDLTRVPNETNHTVYPQDI